MLGRDESEPYLAGLGTVGMEIFEQVSKADAVVLPAAGQYGLLAGTAAAIKHLNSQITVIVSADLPSRVGPLPSPLTSNECSFTVDAKLRWTKSLIFGGENVFYISSRNVNN